VIFGCMMLNSALLLSMRAFSGAMLMLVKKRYLAMYMAGDMALYLLQKVARGDFHYWVPVDGVGGLFLSLLLRVIAKTIADFTGVIQFRADAELGGLYWSVNMFLALLASFVCVWVGGGSNLEWKLVGAASGAWVITFGLILLLMKKEYRGTFYRTKTGNEWAMDFFVKAEDDASKQIIFGCNKKQWLGIRDDVKYWVLGNWWRWVESEPKWFTEVWKAQVPLDMIPVDVNREGLARNRASVRRKSLAEVVVGDLLPGLEELRGGTTVVPVN